MPVTIGVPREMAAGERRVAMTPEAARKLLRKGCEILVESGAGSEAGTADAAFQEAGCSIVTRGAVLKADLVATVQGLPDGDLHGLTSDSVVVGLLRPLDDPEGVQRLASSGATAIAMELIPRVSRAQKMDALSAMSTISGYRAVLMAALHLPKFFPLLTTAAGTVRPARVLVLGAGVAGLQALATARRLGAVTAGYDIRAAAAEQVESVGATFVELDLETGDAEDVRGYAKALGDSEQARQISALATHISEHDVVITTALVPGRSAPLLITRQGVEGMRPGSVIVDLAAPNGGNCELTAPGQNASHEGVTILGPLNPPAEMPVHASQLYAQTIAALIQEYLTDEGGLSLAEDDEILAEATVARGGHVVNERVQSLLETTTWENQP